MRLKFTKNTTTYFGRIFNGTIEAETTVDSLDNLPRDHRSLRRGEELVLVPDNKPVGGFC